MTNTHPVHIHQDNAATPNIPSNNNNNAGTTMPVATVLPQQQLYQQPQQARVVSPGVSPVPLKDPMAVNPNQPVHIPGQPINSNTPNIIPWQQHQQPQFQLNTSSSHDYDEYDKYDVNSDVSSIPWGSIRPDPNYDPAKDPTSPENIDEPFVAPKEIEIRVIKCRRRKTVGSFNDNSTTITPPYVSSEEGDKYSKWHQSPEFPTTQTGTSSIPKLGLINSFASDASESYSSVERFQSAEDMMYLEEDLLELQEMQGDDEAAQYGGNRQRKGMVRREFNRRMLRFKGKKKEKPDKPHDTSGELDKSEDNYNDDDDASGNKIIISVTNKLHIGKPKKPKSLKRIDKFASQFSGRIKHTRSQSMRMVVGQENGC